MRIVTILIKIITLSTILCSFACSKDDSTLGNGTDNIIQPPININTEKTLIVYLSRTNNTKTIAEIIHKNVGGTLVALELETPYPSDYRTTVNQVANENATGFLPPLKTVIDSIQSYDVIFVGFPTWGMQLPPPIKSFLNEYDLRGKTIIPFNTNGGYGIGSSFRTVSELSPESEVLDGFSIRGGSERDGISLDITGTREIEAETEVSRWLNQIGITQEIE